MWDNIHLYLHLEKTMWRKLFWSLLSPRFCSNPTLMAKLNKKLKHKPMSGTQPKSCKLQQVCWLLTTDLLEQAEISMRSHGWRQLVGDPSFKAWFHASEFFCEKLFMRNTGGCTWIIPLNFLFARKKFASVVSRNQFYSLRRRKERENSIEPFMPNHPYLA